MSRLVILIIFLFVLQAITSWVDPWTNVQEEIDQFDSKLSRILYPHLLRKWCERVNECNTVFLDNNHLNEHSNFSTSFKLWASVRFSELCQDLLNNEVQVEVCTYLKLAHDSMNQNVFYPKSNMLLKLRQVRIKWQGQIIDETEVNHIMKRIQDPLESKTLWFRWHQKLSDDLGPEFSKILQEFGEPNFSKLWQGWYKNLGIPSQDIIKQSTVLWIQLKPFYHLLTNYIIKKLTKKFPEDIQLRQGKLSAHLLGSLQGTQFDSIYDLVKPFPEPELEYTEDLIETSVRFYRNLGFSNLPKKIWSNSRVNLTTSCHPFTSVLYNNDVRIVLCKGYTLRHVIHELGHAYTFLSYSNTGNTFFRLHVNEALHESVGELMSLFYNECQLSRNFSTSSSINNLFREALTSLVRMPYALSLEVWRYKAFSEYYLQPLNDLNKLYWNLRSSIQGIYEPEIINMEGTRLDMLDKYHVIDFQPYLSYFYATLLQHQLYESICGVIEKPCCPSARNLDHFRNLLRKAPYSTMGHHKWSEAVEKMFGSGKHIHYTTAPLLRYYRPLIQWLQMQ